jgi:hypothetical protein
MTSTAHDDAQVCITARRDLHEGAASPRKAAPSPRVHRARSGSTP